MTYGVILGAASIIGAVVLLAWSVTSRPSPARANLFSGLPDTATAEPEDESLLRTLGRRTRRALPRPLVDGLEVALLQAGHPGGMDLPRILGVKVVLSSLTALLLILAAQPIIALIAAVLIFFLPDYWVLSTRDKRQAAMQAKLADTIDQLTICVEAGLGFDAALGRVATTNEGPLAEELRRTVRDIQAAVPRPQALRALADRVQIAEVRQLVNALLQAQKHGVALAETLRAQSSEMRVKRRQRTEEKAAKLAVKMLVPIVVCFMPVFMVIAAGPALLNLRNL